MKSCPVGIDLYEERVRAGYFDRQNWFYPLKNADGQWEIWPSLYVDHDGHCFIGEDAQKMLSSSDDMLWCNFLRYIAVEGAGVERNGQIFTARDLAYLFFEKYISDLERQNDIRVTSLIVVPPVGFRKEEERVLQLLLCGMKTIPVILERNPLPTAPPYQACSKCGHAVGKGDLFCRVCGTRYTGHIIQKRPFSSWENIPVAVYGPGPMFWKITCPKCHTSWVEDSMFQPERYCPQCGIPIEDVRLEDE